MADGGWVSGTPAGRTSTADRFQRSEVGTEELTVTGPGVVTPSVSRCTQKPSPLAVSLHWWTIDWPAPRVRAAAESQSLPTPKTTEFPMVVVSPTDALVERPEAPALAPAPPAPLKVTTVSDWS